MFSQHPMFRLIFSALFALGLTLFVGCAGRPTVFPVADKDFNKTAAELAADGAKRSYPASAPKGGEAKALADVDHGFGNRIQVENLSDDDWSDMELWVNEKYVVYMSNWPSKTLKKVNFTLLYDREGKHFPQNNKDIRVQKIELLRDGKLYNVKFKLAD